MHTLIKVIFGLSLVFIFPISYTKAQTKALDSLLNEIQNIPNQNTNLIHLYVKIAETSHTNKQDTCIKYAQKAIDLSTDLNYFPGLVKANRYLAYAFFYQGDYRRSLEIAEEALSYSKRINDTLNAAALYNLSGTLFDVMNMYDRALENYTQSLDLYQRLDDQKYISALHNNMANCYKHLGDTLRAQKEYQKVLHILKDDDLPAMQGRVYLNIGLLKKDLFEYTPTQLAQDSALYYLEEAIHIFLKIDYPNGVAKALKAKGLLAMLDQDFALSETLLDSALNVAKNNSLSKLEVIILADLGALYTQTQAYAKAEKTLNRALGLAEEGGYLNDLRDIYEKKSNLAIRQNDFRGAYTYTRMRLQFNDSVYQQNRERNLAEIRALYENKEQARENSLLQENKSKQELIIRRQYFNQIIISIGLLFLAIIATLLFITNRKTQKLNHRLAQQKHEIEEKRNILSKLNSEILHKNQELEESNQVKNKLFSIISHDLRSPLSDLKNILDLLKDNLLNPEDLQRFTLQLTQKLESSSSLLDNLLHWTRQQMQGLTAKAETVNLHDLGLEALELVKGKAERKNIELRNELPVQHSAWVDANMFRIVLRNLVQNAVKYTSSGGFVRLHSFVEDDFIHVFVEDSGIGMSTDMLSKLFTLTGESRLGTQNEKGTGLGLILSHDLIKLNKGQIWVESTPEKGSRFYLRLPQPQNAWTHQSKASSSSTES